MSLFIATLLLAGAQPAAVPAPAENDIVVIGRRVQRVKFTLKTNKSGQAVCRIKRSSGDPEIDGLACDAARACIASRSEKDMVACLTPRFERIPAQIAARRRSGSANAPK